MGDNVDGSGRSLLQGTIPRLAGRNCAKTTKRAPPDYISEALPLESPYSVVNQIM
jgi:hypothetical protein